MVINGALVLLSLAGMQLRPSPPQPSAGPDSATAAAARRLAATTQLAAQEYRIGVAAGRVIAPAEVEEAALFLREARRSAAALPLDLGRSAQVRLDSLLALVGQVAPPDSLDAGVRRLAASVASGLGITLDETPTATPSLARGAQVYRTACASCHGLSGTGNGPLAASLDPRPADLTSPTLGNRSPLDFYRRITIGVAGTAMPAFERAMPARDRWAAALYASMLRLPPPAGDVPPALSVFPTTAGMSDSALLAALERPGAEAPSLARVARVRGFQADSGAGAQVFGRVRAQLESTYTMARRGDSSAAERAFDAYLSFEQVETSVRAKDPALAGELETAFAALRSSAAGRTPPSELDRVRVRLANGLDEAERVLGRGLSPANLFVQSFVILVREGLEAILIVGALLTFLVKMGAGHRRREVNLGVVAAVGASLLTALALETVFQLTPASREALEGATMVVAAVVLFYVSYWLLSKMEVAKWNRFVRSKVQEAVTSGSALALASAAFLAVYREGFETVLFYKALLLSGGAGGTMPVVGGLLLGSVVMVGIYLALSRFGVRLPLKRFFGVTSAFLYYMALVFAGKGIVELQEGRLIPTTILSGAPRIPALGIYPTLESLGAQAILVLLAAVALVWTFLVAPRRERVADSPGPLRARRGRTERGRRERDRHEEEIAAGRSAT